MTIVLSVRWPSGWSLAPFDKAGSCIVVHTLQYQLYLRVANFTFESAIICCVWCDLGPVGKCLGCAWLLSDGSCDWTKEPGICVWSVSGCCLMWAEWSVARQPLGNDAWPRKEHAWFQTQVCDTWHVLSQTLQTHVKLLMDDVPNMVGKVTLVTGGNMGIGKETTRVRSAIWSVIKFFDTSSTHLHTLVQDSIAIGAAYKERFESFDCLSRCHEVEGSHWGSSLKLNFFWHAIYYTCKGSNGQISTQYASGVYHAIYVNSWTSLICNEPI